MPEAAREAWITGVGIVSSLGEGADTHWEALNEGRIAADAVSHAPYVVHPLAPVDFDKQIPKKGDQRQMEMWQRIGTYAAGLALDDAKAKGDAEILSRMDLIVAAGGGERDLAVDSAVLTALPKASDPAAFLNERLMNDLRPTLFLAQLSNLLAGNISIVHGVAGSSRTFMGEEAAGIEAVRVAFARICAGQSQISLVGGAFNSERRDMLMSYEFGGFNLKHGHAPVWQPGRQSGFALGSLGAFIVIEASGHAQERGVKPLARLSAVMSERTARRPGMAAAALARMYGNVAPRLHPGHCAIISGATGAEPATSEERLLLEQHPELPVRATATALGHGMEAQFPMNIALAAVAVGKGRLFASHDQAGVEKAFDGSLDQVIVTGAGHWRGEGMALVEAVN